MLKKLISLSFVSFSLIFAETTPNSFFFNDVVLEMEDGYNNSSIDDLWSVDSTLDNETWKLEELEVENIQVGDTIFTGTFTSKNGALYPLTKTIVKKSSDNLKFTSTSIVKDTISGLWYNSGVIELNFNAQGKLLSWTQNTSSQAGVASFPVTLNVYRNSSSLVDSVIMNMKTTNNGTTFEMKQKSTYTYDAQNRYTQKFDTTFITVPGLATPMMNNIKKATLTYGGSSVSVIEQDFESGSWINSDTIAVSINSDGRIVSEECYYWDNNSWTKGSKRTYNYENGKLISEIIWTMDGAAWKKTGIKNHYYTAYNGTQLPSIETAIKYPKNGYKINNLSKPQLYIVNNALVANRYSKNFTINGRKIMQLNYLNRNKIQSAILK